MKTIFFLSITFFFFLHGYTQSDPAKKNSSIAQPKVIPQEKNSVVVQDIKPASGKSKTVVARETKQPENADRKKVLTDSQGVQSLSAPEPALTKEKNDDKQNK